MDKTKTINCPCGQPNSLVLIKGVWCYDRVKHGKVEDHPAEGKCVNCHQELAALADEKKAKPAATKKTPAAKKKTPADEKK